MVVASQYSLVTNASCLCISLLKCGMMKPDGIIDEAFVLGGYSKWKDRSIDKRGIEYYNFLWACAIGQIKLLARPCTYTVTQSYRSAWKVK